MNFSWTKSLWLLLVLVGLWRFAQFTRAVSVAFDGDELFFRYQNSQYFKGEKGSFILSDAEHNAVRGYQLVELNQDPEQMLPGHPLFASWLMGLSDHWLGHPLWANILASVAAALVLFLLGKRLLGLVGGQLLLLVFLLEPLLVEQLTTSMLDIFLLAFGLVALYAYLNWLDKNSWSWLWASQISLGLAMTTKFWPAVFPLVVALYLTTVLSGNFVRFKTHTLALLGVGLGFALGNWQYFWFHPSPVSFFLYQRYLISWWAGSPQVAAGQVWDLIFANRWHTWWDKGDVVASSSWWPLWPASVVLSTGAAIKLWRTGTLSLKWVALVLWIGFSLLMFSFSATYPRHLLVILPALYLLSLRLFISEPKLE